MGHLHLLGTAASQGKDGCSLDPAPQSCTLCRGHTGSHLALAISAAKQTGLPASPPSISTRLQTPVCQRSTRLDRSESQRRSSTFGNAQCGNATLSYHHVDRTLVLSGEADFTRFPAPSEDGSDKTTVDCIVTCIVTCELPRQSTCQSWIRRTVCSPLWWPWAGCSLAQGTVLGRIPH